MVDPDTVVISTLDGLQWSPFEERVIRWVLRNTSADRHWCAVSAVRHLNKAWKIRDVDPDMAGFRAMTGQEEATRALLLQLKCSGYRGASGIKPKHHGSKLALWPLLSALRPTVLAGAEQHKSRLVWRGSGRDEVLLVEMEVDGQILYPDPPLYVIVAPGAVEMVPEDQRAKLDTFVSVSSRIAPQDDVSAYEAPEGLSANTESLALFVEAKIQESHGQTFAELLHRQHNARTSILYARSDGLPRLALPVEQIIEETRKGVIVMLTLICLIAPHQRATLVQQLLNVYLHLVDKLPAEEMKW